MKTNKVVAEEKLTTHEVKKRIMNQERKQREKDGRVKRLTEKKDMEEEEIITRQIQIQIQRMAKEEHPKK